MQKLTFELFKEEVVKAVAEMMGSEYSVSIKNIAKNNGRVLSGLTITTADVNIAPTIYLDSYYEDYNKEELSVAEVAEEVIKTYESTKVNKSVDLSDFMRFDGVKDKIIYKLVNTKRNEALLQEVPHIDFLDLSIVFQVLVQEAFESVATVLIKNLHMDIWGVTVDELYEVAKKNTPELRPEKVQNISEVLKEIMSSASVEEIDGIEIDEFRVPMYVASNESKISGAGVILYPNLLHSFCEDKGISRCFIIPSSIHECIFITLEDEDEIPFVTSMISSVNESDVSPEEILSDTLYRYDVDTDEVTIASKTAA